MKIQSKYIFAIILLLISTEVINAQEISNFTLENTDGQIKRYSELKGDKITVIDFWATWCKPCLVSIPKLVELSDSYSDNRVKFIGICVEGPRNISKIKPFAESAGINYPILIDQNHEVSGELNISVIPTLLVIGPENKILYTHEGFVAGDETILKNEIDKMLNEQ